MDKTSNCLCGYPYCMLVDQRNVYCARVRMALVPTLGPLAPPVQTTARRRFLLSRPPLICTCRVCLCTRRGQAEALLRRLLPAAPHHPHAVHQPLPGPLHHLHHLHQRLHHEHRALQPATGKAQCGALGSSVITWHCPESVCWYRLLTGSFAVLPVQ